MLIKFKTNSEMPGNRCSKRVKKTRGTYTADMESTYKELQTKAQTYATDASNQTEIINQKDKKSSRTCKEGFKFQQTVSQEMQKKSVDMMQPLIEKADTIDKVAGQLGFDYVLDSSAGSSVIISKGKDIMDEVKLELVSNLIT